MESLLEFVRSLPPAPTNYKDSNLKYDSKFSFHIRCLYKFNGIDNFIFLEITL